MPNASKIDTIVLASLQEDPGILAAGIVSSDHRQPTLDLERQAVNRSRMGKMTNSGVEEIFKRDRAYVALTNMDFSWGHNPSLVLKKGDEIVGEEIHDQRKLLQLRENKAAWFMHQNFVIYKDRMSFSKDLAREDCYFDLPPLPAERLGFPDEDHLFQAAIYANPSPPTDLFLKAQYFPLFDENEVGLGTILVGV